MDVQRRQPDSLGSLILFVCALVGALGSPVLAGQGTTSRMTGAVTDSSGASLPGATVTLKNEATDVTFTVVTNEAGIYAFEAVTTGRYTVTVELQGFKRFEATDNVVTRWR